MLKRHPLLYYSRYVLLSKNFTGKNPDDTGCYNELNAPQDIPEIYSRVNARIPLTPEMDDFEKALAISTYLRINIKGGPGLSLSSAKTLEAMLDGRGGVCSDFSQVFNNFCVINNIKVKEWNCVDRFYLSQYGHTFNEVYAPQLQKWIAIDMHQSFYFTDENRTPLSVVEAFSRRRAGLENNFEFFVPGYEPKSMDRLKNIFSSKSIPFLTINYKNNEVDRYLDKFAGKFPVFVITTLMILLRKNFCFLFVLDNYKIKLLPKYFQDKALSVK